MAPLTSSPRAIGNCLRADKELPEEARQKGAAYPPQYRTVDQMAHRPAEHLEEHAAHLCRLLDLDRKGNQYFLAGKGVQGMNNANNHDERIAKMTFASVYPHYLAKAEKKGRTKAELHQVIEWLTGFNEKRLQKHIEEKVTFEQFFQHATLNPNAHLITGVICGYRVEEIENPLTQQVRYLDKLVDELAKGRKMEKILRVA